MRQFFIFPPAVLLLLLFGCWAQHPAFAQHEHHAGKHEHHPIKVGISIVASDPAGLPQLRGARLAIEEINSHGGVLGKKLELVPVYNEKRNYAKAQTLIQSLIEEGAKVILTSGGSGMTLKAAEMTVAKDVLLMTASSSTPQLSTMNDKDLVWRTAPSDVFQGRIAARLLDSLQYKKAAVLYIDNAYGTDLLKAFKEAYEKRKCKVVSEIKYPDQPSYAGFDFKPFLDKLYRDKPELVYIIGYAEDAAQITKQSQSYLVDMYRPVLMGCDAHYNPFFTRNANHDFVEGMMGLVFMPMKNYANYEKFLTEFKKHTTTATPDANENAMRTALGAEITYAYAVTAYDAIYTLAFAMAKANSGAPKDIAANLRRISGAKTKGAEIVNVREFQKGVDLIKAGKDINYEGASGKVDFDDNGDMASGSYLVWSIAQGKFIESGRIAFP